ncbi:MAG TPA: DJ-1/PfpI family protein [Acidobacteriota bacterium]|nr:DJ-1/PfpI family protein [Acidobacteriota bacterium]
MRRMLVCSFFVFGIVLGALTAVWSAGAVHGGPALQEQKAEEEAVYVCPPCGIHCDRIHHDKPGQCPVCGMTLIDKRDLLQAALLIAPRMPIYQVAGPAQVFLGSRGFYTYTVAVSGDALVSEEMLEITPQHSIKDSPLPQVLVVGGGNMDILEDKAALEWVQKASENAEAVLGVGLGVAILAKAGVLQGQEAAMPDRYSRLLEHFEIKSAANYRGDRPWIQSGKFVTAVSPDAAMDAALIVVGELMGSSQARQAAQRVGRTLPERP